MDVSRLSEILGAMARALTLMAGSGACDLHVLWR